MGITINNIRTILTAPDGVNLVVVKVETSEPELYGVGCATFTHRYLSVVSEINNYLKPFLIGKDPLCTEDIWQSSMGSGYWRNGPILNNAIAGIDMALWDIKGRMAKLPLYQLIGGKCREGVLSYTHVRGNNKQQVIEMAHQRLEEGFTNLRCHTDQFKEPFISLDKPYNSKPGQYFDPNIYMKFTLEMFEDLRNEFGWDIGLIHDVHERLSPIDAINFSKEMERFKLIFLEDVLPPEHIRWLQMLRNQSSTPIAIGELFSNPNEWIDIIKNQFIDYIRIHISQLGGITPALKLLAFCNVFGIRSAWHGPKDITPIGQAVNIHLDMSCPNFGIQEWFSDYSDEMLDVFPDAPIRIGKYLYISDKPGIGTDIDEKKALKYKCDGKITNWTNTRLVDGTSVRP